MSNIPPSAPGYANYPRESTVSKAKVQAAADAYFGYGKAFLFTILFGIGTAVLHLVSQNEVFQIAVTGLRWVGSAIFAGWITYKPNTRLVFASDWPEGKARTTSVVMGVVTMFCLGIFAFIYGQHLATTQLAKFGVPRKWYGLSKKIINNFIASLPEDSAAVAPKIEF